MKLTRGEEKESDNRRIFREGRRMVSSERQEKITVSSAVTRELITVKTKSAHGDGKLSANEVCVYTRPLRYF